MVMKNYIVFYYKNCAYDKKKKAVRYRDKLIVMGRGWLYFFIQVVCIHELYFFFFAELKV